MLIIQKARISDASAINNVLREAREKAYRGLLPDDVVDWMCNQMRTSECLDILNKLKENFYKMAVAELDQVVIGYTQCGPAQIRICPEKYGEVFLLFVLPQFWRQKIGKKLLCWSETQLRNLDYEFAVLWVLEANKKAQKMYRLCGWKSDGELRFLQLGTRKLKQLRYFKQLQR